MSATPEAVACSDDRRISLGAVKKCPDQRRFDGCNKVVPPQLLKFWVNCRDLTATSLGIMVNKGTHPQMALIQFSEFV